MTWFRLENLWLRKKINLTGFKPRSISNSNRNFKWIQFLNYYNKIETASLVNLIHSLHIFLVFIKIYKLNVKILGHATRAHIWNISQYISHNDVLKEKRFHTINATAGVNTLHSKLRKKLRSYLQAKLWQRGGGERERWRTHADCRTSVLAQLRCTVQERPLNSALSGLALFDPRSDRRNPAVCVYEWGCVFAQAWRRSESNKVFSQDTDCDIVTQRGRGISRGHHPNYTYAYTSRTTEFPPPYTH